MPSLAEAEIQALIADHWRTIRLLTEEADRKTAHMKLLFKNNQTPYFRDDAPAQCWGAILDHARAIQALEEVLRRTRDHRFRQQSKRR